MASKYLLTENESGKFHFSLCARNNEIILSSQMYESRFGALNGIESCRASACEDSNYDRKTSSNGQYYFNLKAANHQVIGTSEMYTSMGARENGISSVKTNAGTAPIVER